MDFQKQAKSYSKFELKFIRMPNIIVLLSLVLYYNIFIIVNLNNVGKQHVPRRYGDGNSPQSMNRRHTSRLLVPVHDVF